MNTQRVNWKFYLFLAIAGVILFRIPPADTAALILWTLGVYGAIMLWVMDQHTRSSEQRPRDEAVGRPHFEADLAFRAQGQVAAARSNGHREHGIAGDNISFQHQVPGTDASGVGAERN